MAPIRFVKHHHFDLNIIMMMRCSTCNLFVDQNKIHLTSWRGSQQSVTQTRRSIVTSILPFLWQDRGKWMRVWVSIFLIRRQVVNGHSLLTPKDNRSAGQRNRRKALQLKRSLSRKLTAISFERSERWWKWRIRSSSRPKTKGVVFHVRILVFRSRIQIFKIRTVEIQFCFTTWWLNQSAKKTLGIGDTWIEGWRICL